MPSVEVEDTRGHGIGGFLKEGNNTARLAIVCEKLNIFHLTDFRGRPDEGKRHLSIRPNLTFTQQKVDVVGIRRVFVFLPRGENRKTAIDTLRTFPAMRI